MKWYLAVFILFCPVVLKAQRKVTHTNMLWGGYYSNINIDKRWAVNSDGQIRSRDWTDKWSQVLVRSGISYKLNDKFSVTAGMAWFKNIQYINDIPVFKNEIRPWQEVALQLKMGKEKLSQRLRAEQRFQQQVVNGKTTGTYDHIFRLRYKIDWQRTVSQSLTVIAANEVMVNPAYITDSRFFDQNRISAAIQWKASKSVALQWQYMKIFQWKSSSSTLEDQNVFRVVVYHQIQVK